jgi:hypothetical protein
MPSSILSFPARNPPREGDDDRVGAVRWSPRFAMSSLKGWLAAQSIWVFAFGYFACYVPYSLLTKLLTKGLVPGIEGRVVSGFSILPVSAIAATVAMLVFLSSVRWWRHATHTRILGQSIPTPTRWTLLSGVCAAGTIGTTTLAYTFEGVSIVFAMLLMRGGVLVIAPIVDALAKRKVRWFAWAGLALSISALLVSVTDTRSYAMPLLCGIDIAVYLASYFVRLRFMSRLAKSADADSNKRYFVEEQMVATPALVVLLALAALFAGGEIGQALREGFSGFLLDPVLVPIIVVGVLSQGTGVFGNLIYLDRRENTYCVPVNRSSSVLAGVVASYLLLTFPGQRPPQTTELIGAAMIIGAIGFLTVPPMMAARRERKKKEAAAVVEAAAT